MLAEAGITAAVDCTSNVKLKRAPCLQVYRRLVINHVLNVADSTQFADEIAAVAALLDSHHTIIFCEHGRHRSATTCAALLMLLTGAQQQPSCDGSNGRLWCVEVFGPAALARGSCCGHSSRFVCSHQPPLCILAFCLQSPVAAVHSCLSV